jgi:CubicO group peptidase (beta-lactamase class C family)
VAFLIIRNDSVLNEYYWDQYDSGSLSNSFSMAKSITTMLAQIAIQKGILKGWDQKVKELLPELKGPHAGELQLWHLSSMSSGMDWEEKYKDPFSVTAKAYYGDDLGTLMLSLPIKDKPGTFYNYQSGSTQLLGMCVMKAAGSSLSALASDWLWKPLQAENAASWHTDDKGMELAYCCFNSNARDFARLGKLMLHYGNWNGLQILDSSFVVKATKGALVPYYGYSFWIDESHGTKVFYQRGILGQYIISIPEYQTVIVRLGHRLIPPEEGDHHSPNFHVIVEETLRILRSSS